MGNFGLYVLLPVIHWSGAPMVRRTDREWLEFLNGVGDDLISYGLYLAHGKDLSAYGVEGRVGTVTDNIVYDNHFNGNEWFVVGLTVFFMAAIWWFPRGFSPTQTTLNLSIGIAFGLMFDHTIFIPPFDLYDVGDQSKYELFDIISYVMYAPFGYWFIYWYERMRIRGILTILYILIWTGLAILVEWLGVKVGLFHYKNGYQLIYSIPIYLLVQSFHLGLYRTVFARDRWQRYHSTNN